MPVSMMMPMRDEAEGQRQQQRHAGERAEPRQHPDEGAPQAADEAVERPLPGQRDLEAAEELVESRHGAGLPAGPPGQQAEHRVEIDGRSAAAIRAAP